MTEDYKIEKPKVEPVKIITIDETPYAVDSMSDDVQQMVKVFNRWNDDEADIQHEVNLLADKISMIRAAKDTVSRQILDKVREEKRAKEEQPDEADAPSEGLGGQVEAAN